MRLLLFDVTKKGLTPCLPIGPCSHNETQHIFRGFAMTRRYDLPQCPVALTVNIIGSKWKLLILQQLSTGGKRFNELQRALSGISNKALSSSLHALDEDGIILRHVHNGCPISVEYKLSDIGLSLKPVLDAMSVWGTQYRLLRKQHCGYIWNE